MEFSSNNFSKGQKCGTKISSCLSPPSESIGETLAVLKLNWMIDDSIQPKAGNNSPPA